jgi:hypothetical protein
MPRSTALLCLILLVWAAPAMAQNEIHRCVGADGHPLFTDQSCAALQATSVNAVAAVRDDTHSTEPPPIMCAASLGELRQSVIGAFASRDANRLAGLMLWSGYGHGAAVADIRSLRQAMKQPLLDVSPSSAGDDPPAPAATTSSAEPFAADPLPAGPAGGNQLVLHTAGNDGSDSPHELRFSIVRRAGCLWLRNAD